MTASARSLATERAARIVACLTSRSNHALHQFMHCPRCSPEMAAILRDSAPGREAALSARLTALTMRTLAKLRVTARHSIAPLLAVAAAPSLANAVRAARTEPMDSRVERIEAGLSQGRSDIAAAPKHAASTYVAAPPDLAQAIRQRRS